MKDSERNEALWDHSLEIEEAIHVQTMLAGNPCDRLKEAIDDGELEGAIALLEIDPDEFVEALKEEELGWMLRDCDGWLVAVSAPRVGPWKKLNGMRSRSVHTGWRTTRWFKADTYEAAIEAAIAWAESDPAELVVPEKDARA